jgi:hypothetical protein
LRHRHDDRLSLGRDRNAAGVGRFAGKWLASAAKRSGAEVSVPAGVVADLIVDVSLELPKLLSGQIIPRSVVSATHRRT